jgi:hypothetical protein
LVNAVDWAIFRDFRSPDMRKCREDVHDMNDFVVDATRCYRGSRSRRPRRQTRLAPILSLPSRYKRELIKLYARHTTEQIEKRYLSSACRNSRW